ncbi:MAG: hypothetical protein IJA69_01890, partial [Clostridia bacterium]|nr:hypothetical protein [Clostridia bacterium]
MLLSVLSLGVTNQDFCYAEEEMTYEEIQEKLEQTIGGQLDNLDFSDFDNIISSLDENQVKIFGSSNFYDKLKKLTMGEQNGDQQGIW